MFKRFIQRIRSRRQAGRATWIAFTRGAEVTGYGSDIR
jgi:hypothetical protein